MNLGNNENGNGTREIEGIYAQGRQPHAYHASIAKLRDSSNCDWLYGNELVSI